MLDRDDVMLAGAFSLGVFSACRFTGGALTGKRCIDAFHKDLYEISWNNPITRASRQRMRDNPVATYAELGKGPCFTDVVQLVIFILLCGRV